jgi:hypothetical protein
MRRVVFALSVVTAFSFGLWQGPGVESADHLVRLSGAGNSQCTLTGYDKDCSCKTYNSACTGGKSDIAHNADSAGKDYQTTGFDYSHGNCTGKSGCPSAINTSELTTDGCGG